MAEILKTFTKCFVAWMNPTNMALNAHSKNPANDIKHRQDPAQSLSHSFNTEWLTWKRVPIKAYFTTRVSMRPLRRA